MRKDRNKKILIIGTLFILTTAIVTPILVITQSKKIEPQSETKENENSQFEKIKAITIENIINHDGIDTSVKKDIPKETFRIVMKKSIETYVNSLPGVSGWIARIHGFERREEVGGLHYSLYLSKGTFAKAFIINYKDKTFKTKSEVEIDRFNAVTIADIIKHDGIDTSVKKDIPKETFRIVMKKSIETYVNSLPGVSGWIAWIHGFERREEVGGLHYSLYISKGTFAKAFIINYKDKTFKTKSEVEIDRFNAVTIADIIKHDGIDTSVKKDIPKETFRIVMKKSIETYVNSLPGVSGWIARIHGFERREEVGGLHYSLYISKGTFAKAFIINYKDKTFKTKNETNKI